MHEMCSAKGQITTLLANSAIVVESFLIFTRFLVRDSATIYLMELLKGPILDDHRDVLWMGSKSLLCCNCKGETSHTSLFDGHSTHIDVETSKFCKDNGILLYCLPAHSLHITQSLDVGFFKPSKVRHKRKQSRYHSHCICSIRCVSYRHVKSHNCQECSLFINEAKD